MSPFCEQMGLGECMLWNSADARESMTFNNSISSSIIQFIVSLILSHNCWFIGLFIQRNHVLFRVLVYLHVGKSLVPGRSFVSADSVKESFNLLISSLVRFSELQRSFLDEEEWLYYFIFLGGWFPFLNSSVPLYFFLDRVPLNMCFEEFCFQTRQNLVIHFSCVRYYANCSLYKDKWDTVPILPNTSMYNTNTNILVADPPLH